MKMFVYGSLMSGMRANEEMDGAELVCPEAVTVDPLSMYINDGYPFVFNGRSKCRIKGELYEVPDSLLKRLTDYEGEFYYMTVTDVICAERTVCAYIFMGRGHHCDMAEVADGDYRKFYNAENQ
ncbi:MAG: gamma-glutamylcyclotransferase [Deferribacterales bacterium]